LRGIENSDNIGQLLDLLGGLPIAIAQAGAFIKETAYTITQYLERYQETCRHLMDLKGFEEMSLYGDSKQMRPGNLDYFLQPLGKMQRNSSESLEALDLFGQKRSVVRVI